MKALANLWTGISGLLHYESAGGTLVVRKLKKLRCIVGKRMKNPEVDKLLR